MVRTPVLFPTSADVGRGEDSTLKMASAFRGRPSLLRMTSSVDHLMGPGAERGTFGGPVEADLEEPGGLRGLLDSQGFRVRTAIEPVKPTLLLGEYEEL
jgi:hypothetical protein